MPHLSSLKGKCVVITRKRTGDKTWELYLKKQGAMVKYFPTIETTPIPLSKKNVGAIKNIDAFDWIVFTSAEGVRSFKTIKDKPMPRIAAVGAATALAVRKAGYRVAFQPSVANGATLAKELAPVKGRSILLLRSAIALSELPKILTARGATVTDVPAYKTQIVLGRNSTFEALLKKGKIDHIVFASPSALRGFLIRVPRSLHRYARHIPTIAIGKSLHKPLKNAGFTDISTAKEPTIQGIVRAMI